MSAGRREGCLHCEILDLVNKRLAGGMPSREVAVSVMYALADVCAAPADPAVRANWIENVRRQLPDRVAQILLDRAAGGGQSSMMRH